MSESGLDQLVKGSPPPNVSLPSVAAAASAASPHPDPRVSPGPPDPTSLLPSSPPQIYLNLLILEASLRSQYLTLRARRRQNTFVLIVLAIWILYFIYCQFLRPRADGTGVGGSEYWFIDMLEKVALSSGCIMALLFYVTGQWERGVRWPGKWLRTTNRGLRGMNCKAVVLRGPWWRNLISHLSIFFPISTLVDTPGSNYQYVEHIHTDRHRPLGPIRPRSAGKERIELAEEDIAPGGDYIKLLLLPKHFTPEFRENWEVYRAEYWDAENTRREDLRRKHRALQKALAKQRSPWFWWLPGPRLPAVPEKRTHRSADSIARINSQRHKRASSFLAEKGTSHSRSSSRSSVGMPPETDERERRWSTSTTSSVGGERRRRKAGSVDPERRSSVVGRMKLTPAAGMRPTTPTTDILRPKFGKGGAVSSGSEGDSPSRRRVSARADE